MSDYDYPKSLRSSHAMEDYDYPRGSKHTSYNSDRSLSAVPPQLKRSSDSSGESRPMSQSSGSMYSADTSSGSLDSSLASVRELPGYDVPKRVPSQPTSSMIRQSELNLDDELRKIDGLMEEVNVTTQHRVHGLPSVSSANRVTLDGYEIAGLGKQLNTDGESKRSSSSKEESLSSRSGSNDTLGVWDDVSFHDEESEGSEEGDGDAGAGGADKGLDSWIKELESGMKGISEVAGIHTPDPQTPTVKPPTPVNKPLPSPPLPTSPTTPLVATSVVEPPSPVGGGATENGVVQRRKSDRLTLLANDKVRERGKEGETEREREREVGRGRGREMRKKGRKRGRKGVEGKQGMRAGMTSLQHVQSCPQENANTLPHIISHTSTTLHHIPICLCPISAT